MNVIYLTVPYVKLINYLVINVRLDFIDNLMVYANNVRIQIVINVLIILNYIR